MSTTPEPPIRPLLLLMSAAVALGGDIHAQPASAANTPRPAASSPQAAGSDAVAQRVQQQADNVFKWIKAAGNKPRKAEPAPVAPDPNKRAVAKPAVVAPPAVAAVAAAAQPVTPLERASAPAEVAAVEAAAVLPATAASQPLAVEAAPAAAGKVTLQVIHREEPNFPADVMRDLGTGSVRLRLTVEPNGSVGAVEVLSSPNRRLNRAAMEALKLWRFEPVPTAQTAQVELGFSLD